MVHGLRITSDDLFPYINHAVCPPLKSWNVKSVKHPTFGFGKKVCIFKNFCEKTRKNAKKAKKILIFEIAPNCYKCQNEALILILFLQYLPYCLVLDIFKKPHPH